MLCGMAVLALLFFVAGGFRARAANEQSSDAEFQLDSEIVPAEISNALRKAQKHELDALKDAETHQQKAQALLASAADTEKQKLKAEQEKDAAAAAAVAKTREASEQAKAKATAAAAALESNQAWSEAVKKEQATQAKLNEAVEAENTMNNHVQGEIRKLKKRLADAQQFAADATADHEQAGLNAEELRVAYQVAQDHVDGQVKAFAEANALVNEANKLASEKAASAQVAGREADAARTALNDAMSELNDAKQVVTYMKEKIKALKALYTWIQEFYLTLSKFAEKAMGLTEDEENVCVKEPHECIILDNDKGGYRTELKAVLEGYNSMVLAFMKIKELYNDVYAVIEVARDEIDKNAMAQVHLVCDPAMELEEENGTNALSENCGDGLWPAVGLRKNRFF